MVMLAEKNVTQINRPVRDSVDTVVVVDVGSARVACAVAEIGHEQPVILAAECATSFGIRGGEIVDLKRAGEAIRIAIEAAADKAEVDVRTVVVGLSGDVKLSSAKAGMDLDGERRVVSARDMKKLRGSVHADVAAGRRIVHRFDGPYSVGDLHGIDHPEGLAGERLEMQASFLSASGDRLDNLLRAVRDADVAIEAVSLEPMSCSLGALSPDERALGAVVLDLGAGAFRGALWEGGRLRQIQMVGRESATVQTGSGRALANPVAAIGGMEGIVMALARRFRIAPATAERLLRTHAALGEDALAGIPPFAEVAAVDGLGSVRVETLELSRTIEELLSPVARTLREGLSGYSAAHAVGVVLTGGGARIKGMGPWIAKRFGGAPVRLGLPRWKVEDRTQVPADLLDCAGCSLSGLIALGSEARVQMRKQRPPSIFSRLTDGLKRLTASF
jgi:cell division ATPase FtsA